MGQFRFITAGESHGKGLVAIVEGMVAGLSLEAEYINKELKRRQQGYGRGPRMEIEQDKAEIISGVRYGLTMGSPIALFIPNRDWQNWQEAMSITPLEKEAEPVTRPRPGHADLAGVTKYSLKDIRPIMERASARETAARVAAGAISKRFLEEFGIVIHSHTIAIGTCHCEPFASFRVAKESCYSERSEESHGAQGKLRQAISTDWQQVEASPLRCVDAELEKEMIAAIDRAKAEGDTLGGVFELIATGVPIGLGSHVSWDRRLDGRIARAIMSINAVKGVEIGAGFTLAKIKGSQAHDVIEPNPPSVIARDSPSSSLRGASATKQSLPWHHATNYAGGIEGGISNGEEIIIRAAVKPIATLAKPLSSIDLRSGEVAKAHYERSDICVVPAAGVIGEAMLAIILADACLEKFGGDNLKETLANYHNYISHISLWR
ncbi:Chorismate synthase [subsurface metagenome]|nr:chorismate synthase [Dehalococcoidia bacterium]